MSGGSRAPGPRRGRGLCRSCSAHIVWFMTTAGKKIPIDSSSVKDDDQVLDLTRHVSHFATCPEAAKFRRPR